MSYSPVLSQKYQGQGEATLTNVVRGSKNFQDGQWLGWLGDDVNPHPRFRAKPPR